MKKLILLLIIICSISSFGQESKKAIKYFDMKNLVKPVQQTEDMQIKICIANIIHTYKNSYKYYNELTRNQYEVDYANSRSTIKVKDNNGNILEKLELKKVKDQNGIEYYEYNSKAVESSVDKTIFKSIGVVTKNDGGNTIYTTDNMLRDCEILNFGADSNYGKILNEAPMLHYVKNQYDQPAIVFYDIEAGGIIPYGSGNHAKLVAVDNIWGSITTFDKDNLSQGGKPYGYIGIGNNEYLNPTSIAIAPPTSSGGFETYPTYIVDSRLHKIVRVDFTVNNSGDGSNGFDPNTYRQIDTLIDPYDISYFVVDPETKSHNKLWVSQNLSNGATLNCFDTNGTLEQKVVGYINNDTHEEFYFLPDTYIRLSTYYTGFYSLCFIDDSRNCLVCTLLNADGTASLTSTSKGNLINITGVDHFDESYPLNSIHIQTPVQESAWPYVWLTSGYRPPYYSDLNDMIHVLKMNKSGHTQYLGSTAKPRNTDNSFYLLKNLMTINHYFDIFSIEKWNFSYGLRRYLPYADVRSEVLHNYCSDSLNYLKWEATFTNDCWVKLSAERKNQNNQWNSVKFNYILNDGVINLNDPYNPILWENAGYTEGDYIRIKLDLPIEDYALGDSIRLHAKFYPQWADNYNLDGFPYDVVEKTYNAFVQKTCLPKPGGCPFLYVKDTSSNYFADNNILHRSEFSGSVDITDKYKLRYVPQIASNKITLSLVENENDNAYINMVKLYAVDYPTNRHMGITENNLIVLYDTGAATASDSVMLGSSNITNNVNVHHPSSSPTLGKKTDSLYAHFSYGSFDRKNIVPNRLVDGNRTDLKNSAIDKNLSRKKSNNSGDGINSSSLVYGFISELGNLQYPIASAKDTGGVLIAHSVYSNTVTTIFARRENNSVVILPLFGDSNKVSNFTVNWQSDFRMKYLGVTPLEYSGYTSTEIPLSIGHSITSSLDSTITSALTDVDTNYGLVNSSGLITMVFDASSLPSIPSHNQRSYVIEVNGHYTTGSNNSFSLNKQNQIPLIYRLSQNYPNPFNPVTRIIYEIPKDERVKLVIYDVLGREVKNLIDNEFKQAGRYNVTFDGTNLASGVYFYRIEAGSFVESKKMVLIK